jgi:hypothetical protein
MSVKPDFCNIPRMLSRSGVVVFVLLLLAELADGATVDVLGALVCAIAAVVHSSSAVPVARTESRIVLFSLGPAAHHTVNRPRREAFRQLSDMRVSALVPKANVDEAFYEYTIRSLPFYGGPQGEQIVAVAHSRNTNSAS